MDKIEVKLLNPDSFDTAMTVMVAGARLTQRGEQIKDMHDFMELYKRPVKQETLDRMVSLPHANIQRFGMPIVAVVGASRRFLAQITRHQDDVHFISASLQYSDYSNEAAFCVPYTIMQYDKLHVNRAALEEGYYTRQYIKSQQQAMAEYEAAIKAGVDHDAAAYMMPQGLRNVLIIGATPFQWKHMISQRVCNRNTLETQYVMLLIWEELCRYNCTMMWNSGPDCTQPCGCREGTMNCGESLKEMCGLSPMDYLKKRFPLLVE